MDLEYPVFAQLHAYLIYLGYAFDPSQKIGNTEYWENATGDFVIFAANSRPIEKAALDEILTSLCKEEKDFKAFCLAIPKSEVTVANTNGIKQ
jgi:hypothetical protein